MCSVKKNVTAKKNMTAVVKAAAPKKIRVSAGVMAGKLGGMTPQYPAIAKAARVQGGSGGGRAEKAKKSGASRDL
jgi:hypothetical protein